MTHKLALDLSDEVFGPLAREAEKSGQSAEGLAVRLLEVAVLKWRGDPLESFIGTFDSGGINWVDRHDAYLGQSVLEVTSLQ